jgi:hypothetical protein
MRVSIAIQTLALSCICCGPLFAQPAEPWQSGYTGEDASGSHVVAFWNCDEADGIVSDVSGKGHDGTLAGVSRRAEGRFGRCIESFPGGPVEDVAHAVVVANSPDLSPQGAFSMEMWICPGETPAGYGESFLVDKKYVAHADYQWILGAPDKQGGQRMKATLGFGQDSDTWYASAPALLQKGQWSHIAITYDGAGTLRFFQDGRSLGGENKPARGSICPGTHHLSLGDRVGSYYHGFPGLMDDIRITTGAREFRPITVTPEHIRTVYERMEPAPSLKFRLANNRRDPITGLEVVIRVPGLPDKTYPMDDIAPGASRVLEYAFDTRLRPDTYPIAVSFQFQNGDQAYRNSEDFKIALVARKPPFRMPVVMWGVGGVEGVLENVSALKEIGFTHCLGLRCDFNKIWEAGAPVAAVNDDALAGSYRMLDRALAHDLGIVISVSPGAWLEEKEQFLRTGPAGTPYERPNICCNFPEVQAFAQNVGASIAQTYGQFPAFRAALIHTEVRDGTQLCFHEHDRARYQAAAGKPFPENIGAKNGISYTKIPGFPENRVVPDDYDLLQCYRWFWREGDGWNGLHSAVNQGLKSTGRKDLWTFFDPAVRVPALWGSGGSVDFLSHWTYSYPDPIRIGLATDELFAMAEGGPEGQGVMKMTQVIWYRSQTAPPEKTEAASVARSPWEDFDPDADYITIAPMHLREAFWTKLARPIKGIMYHGWQSLVPTEGPSAYRYTHPETQHALKELVNRVVEPLGPTLLQVPAAQSDVAFLESFTSAMFAGRGTYGWGGSWAGDAYHVLMYAHLQPEIVYEETVMKRGLDGYKVLVLADCDVLPRSVVERINAFKGAGGIIIGDDRLCPAVVPDILLESYSRTKKADVDKNALLERADALLKQLGGRYQAYAASSVADVLPYRRQYGTSDYLFAINDRREFGSYVGHHQLVMEQGLPAQADFTIQRPNGCVYDLVEHREVHAEKDGKALRIPVELEPGGGRLWLITDHPIEQISIQAPQEAKCSEEVSVQAAVTDNAGNAINAIVPLEVRILDPDGRQSEFSGFYGAVDGKLALTLTFASNDLTGVWTIEVKELASGKCDRHFIRLLHGPDTQEGPNS